MSPPKSRLWIIPPLILAVVAINQILFAQFLKLDRWEGGGFGMYCSVDQARLRPLRLIVSTELGDLPAEGVTWKHNRERLVTLPNTSLLVDELNAQADKEWVVMDPDGTDSSDAEGAGDLATVSGGDHARVVQADASEDDVSPIVVEGLHLNVYRMQHAGDGRMTVEVLKSVSN